MATMTDATEQTLEITYLPANREAVALRISRAKARGTKDEKVLAALTRIAGAVLDGRAGRALIGKDDARMAHGPIVIVVEEEFGTDRKAPAQSPSPLEDLTAIVHQIQNQFRLVFTIREGGRTQTISVGDGPHYHRVLASIALQCTAIDEAWDAPYGSEVEIDLEDTLPAARSAAELVAGMKDEVRHQIEVVRAALAEMAPAGSATVSLR